MSDTKRKYEMLLDDTIEVRGNDGVKHTLHRIKAVTSFNDVTAGDLGGYIESEDNLEHAGWCWVYDEARVYGQAMIHGHAKLRDHACVFDEAVVAAEGVVEDSAEVYNNAFVNAYVGGSAKVRGYANVLEDSKVMGKAIVEDCTVIKGKAEVSGESTVECNAIIAGNAYVAGLAKITNNAVVAGNVVVKDACVVGGDAILKGDECLIDCMVAMELKNQPLCWQKDNYIFCGVAPGHFLAYHKLFTLTRWKQYFKIMESTMTDVRFARSFMEYFNATCEAFDQKERCFSESAKDKILSEIIRREEQRGNYKRAESGDTGWDT